jgi:hypothetical protein
MFEDLREQANNPYFEEVDQEPEEFIIETHGQFLGMSPFQRFIIAIMFFLIVLLIGSFALLVLGRVMPPFFG